MNTKAESIQRYETNQGARIFRIPLNLFPELNGFAHIVLFNGFCILFDVGSGFGRSNEQLEEGLYTIRDAYDEKIDWSNITHILISHGHIDHFGGLAYVKQRCAAPVIVHSLDRRVLTHYEERLTLVARRLEHFLAAAGLTPERIEGVMAMYMLNKGLFESQHIDYLCEELDMHLGRMKWVHVPGHCPGQIVAHIDDFLLSADHVLETTSPHQAPESLTLSTGLNHYLESLAKIRPLASQVNLTLGGHEGPVYDLDSRLCEIAWVHRERLAQILSKVDKASTIDEISRRLFPDVEGYHQLLAIEETAAHVEYLHQRGFLTVENHVEIKKDKRLPIRYRRTEDNDFERLNTAFDPFNRTMQVTSKPADIFR
jgi:glyoxylase-like metal-dependent hydrolase (beta-lactamase superfamily II)